ncbi:MAG: hypothetical protein Q4C88_00140 [Akkermansia sp.]|nr:hypothetical protein [Akkermansia sp.]
MPPFLLRFWVLVKRVVKSTWMVPVLCVAAALLYAGVVALDAALGSTSPAWELAGELAAGLSLLALLLLVIWLVGSMFLKQTNGKRGLRVLFAFLGGGAALVIGAVTTTFLAFADIDHRADGWRVPEGVALEVPQQFWVEDTAPDIVKRIVGRSSNECSGEFSHIPAEGDFPLSAAHLEQLANQHPDLLGELCQRASCLAKTELLCQEAWATSGVMGEYSYRCCACLQRKGENDLKEYHYSKDFTHTHPLANGWEIRLLVDRITEPSEAKDRPEAVERLEGYAMQRLDEQFAQLAAAPTRETVDALVPLPARPSICLGQDGQPGIYKLSLFLPKDARDDGHYEIRAFEYESGKQLSLDNRADYLQFVGEPDDRIVTSELLDCRVITVNHFMVYTGNWGQFYGSRWDVWFVPDKGDPVMLSSQNFLMQGWMR